MSRSATRLSSAYDRSALGWRSLDMRLWLGERDPSKALPQLRTGQAVSGPKYTADTPGEEGIQAGIATLETRP